MMIVVRILFNAIIMAIEIAAVLGIAYLGWKQPLYFAAATAAIALVMGYRLEQARIGNEIPFYFNRRFAMLSLPGKLVALGEALFKSILGGIVALLTFSGTDANRLFWVACIFAGALYLGSSLLRRLSISFGGVSSRWGYFRLAAPLGLVYSIAVAFLPVPSTGTVATQLLFNLPARPSLAQASEVLFILKQKFDELLVGLLSQVVGVDAAKVLGLIGSVNVLTGFVIAVYAVLIAETVRLLEERVP